MAAGPLRLRGIVTLVALCAALAGAASPALAANSRVCRQLEADLAATYGGKTVSAQVRKQDASINRQREQLQLARKRSRASGCGFSLFGRGNAQCGAINAKIEKMERNLDALQRKRTQMALGGGSGKSRARVMAALDANGCRDDRTAERRLPRGLERGGNILEQIFGGQIRSRSSLDDEPEAPRRQDAKSGLGVLKPRDGQWINEGGHIRFIPPPGNYRTLCVRTCDGYFFPMSSASSPMDFDRDQKNCESSCPGTEVQLYYHRAKGEESEDMVSPGSGAPYSELPTAYLYKQIGVPQPAGCGCGKPRNYNAMSTPVPAAASVEGEPADQPAAAPSSIVTLGAAKPAAKATAIPGPVIGPERDETAADRNVRAVGPAFLPDQ